MLKPSTNNTLVGYARVSSSEQSLALQREALYQAGCLNICEDFAKYNATIQRNGLIRLRNTLRRGDTLVIWRLDRLSYSMTGLLQIINELGYRGIAFRSLCENIELCPKDSCKFMTVFSAIRPHVTEEFEGDGWRKLVTKRTEGRMGTQKSRLSDQITKDIQSYLNHSSIPVAAIAERYKISRATIYNTLVQGATTKEAPKPDQISTKG